MAVVKKTSNFYINIFILIKNSPKLTTTFLLPTGTQQCTHIGVVKTS